MMNKTEENDLIIFFRYLIVGFIISSFRIDFKNMTPIEIVGKSFVVFGFNFIAGIFTGLTAMLTMIIYKALKKNLVEDNGLFA